MSRLLALLLLGIIPTVALAAPPKASDVPADATLFVHIDVDAVHSRPFGRELISTIFELPNVQKQWNAMPDSLAFIKKLRFHDITIMNVGEYSNEPTSDTPIIRVRVDFDQANLLKVIGLGRDYAEVSYHGVPIHHWRVNQKAIGDVLLERTRTEEEKAKDSFEPVYLTIPEPGVIMLSSSLAHQTMMIDLQLGRIPSIDRSTFAKWTPGKDRLLYVGLGETGDEYLRNFHASIGFGGEGRIAIEAVKKCDSENERNLAKMVSHVINNITTYRDMLSGIFPKKSEKEGEDEIKTVAESTDDESDKERSGRLTFGVSMDGVGPDENGEFDENWIDDLAEVVARTVKAKYENDTLSIAAAAFPERWDVSIKSEGMTDVVNIQLHLKSDEQARLASEPKSSAAKKR